MTHRHRPRGLDIVYEDRDLLIVDKSAGLLTMSFHKDQDRTAEVLLNDYVRKGCIRSRNRVFLVHRLDRETSGLLVFARSEAVQQHLKDHWQDTHKFYLAAVHGHLEKRSGLISTYLAEDEDQFVRSVQDPQAGRLAQTEYWVIKETHTLSLLKIRLLTGRKNQIRVHFAERGHPVVGDPKYGRRNRSGGDMALHAKSLALDHPRTGQRLCLETAIPERFQRLANGLTEEDWAGRP